MAEAEGKSGVPEKPAEPATISKDSGQNEKNDDNSGAAVETKGSSMKSSWSGWFQKVNDAVLSMTKDDDEKEEEKEEEKDKEAISNAGDENKGSSWGSWGSSLLQQAKEKTLTTLEMVKKDLTEFSDVVQNETAHILSASATTIRDRAPQLVGSIVGTVNTVLLVEDTTSGEEANEIPITNAAAVYANRSQARLYAIQSDPETYCNEPDGAPELFDDWLDHQFTLEDKKEEISHLLVTNPAVRNLFAQLVPSQVSNTTFWQRYFYRLHQFELDEARRRALLQREEAAANRDSSENPHLSWGDESDLEEHREHVDSAETESFCDLAKDVASEDEHLARTPQPDLSPTSGRQQSPLCGREPPEGVNAVPKAWDGQRRDSFNVEIKAAEEQEKQKDSLQPLDTDIQSVSSFGTPPRNDGESGSPTDKKSDDWVEWEGNENAS